MTPQFLSEFPSEEEAISIMSPINKNPLLDYETPISMTANSTGLKSENANGRFAERTLRIADLFGAKSFKE